MFNRCGIIKAYEAAPEVLVTPMEPGTHNLCERLMFMTELYHPAQQLYLFNPSIEHVTPDCTCQGRQCHTCQTLRCIDMFNRHIRKKGGLATWCKLCHKAYREANAARIKAYNHSYHEQHREQEQSYRKEYYQEHAHEIKTHKKTYRQQNHELVLAREKAYREQHGDLVRAKSRNYSRVHAEENRQRARSYWEKHSDRRRAYRRSENGKASNRRYVVHNRSRFQMYEAIRRTRKTHAGGSYTVAEWEALKVRYDHACLCCGKKEPDIKLTADHVIPVTKGGTSNIDNIQPLCMSCNARKNSKIIDYRSTWKGESCE